MIEVAERYVYPVKSMAGFLLPDDVPMEIGPEGVEGSRRWMVLDNDIQPVTARQRGMESMLAIHPVPAGGDSFILGDEVLVEPLDDGPTYVFDLFKDGMKGRECSVKGTEWIRRRLGRNDIQLVHFDQAAGRRVHPEKLWKGSDPRAFVDGAQITLYSENTAQELKLRHPQYDADPRRPRPDFIVHNTIPLEEFNWADFQVKLVAGSAVLQAHRPIDRCPMPGIHPDTLVRTGDFARMINDELRMDTPDPAAGPLPCFSIGLKVVEPGIIRAQAEVSLLG